MFSFTLQLYAIGLRPWKNNIPRWKTAWKRWKRAPHIVSFIYSPTLLVRNISQSRPHNPWFSLQSQRAAKNCTTTERGMDNFKPFTRAVESRPKISDNISTNNKELYASYAFYVSFIINRSKLWRGKVIVLLLSF